MARTPLSTFIIVAFLVNTFGPLPAQAQGVFLPAPGVRVSLSPQFNPPVLKGLKVHPDNPFRFDFILDKGDSALANDQLKEESSKLIKYFLASLTVPEKDLWVNLSPYEKDRIVPESFGQTEMGRDLLAQDYLLKQITASLIYPEDEFGKIFWNRVYQEASKRYGTTNIPVNTFNKVWIVPEKAVVYENAKAGTAYVVESRLKVMLEQDYLALEKGSSSPDKDVNALGSQIVREIVIPQLTKEVNENKNFAQLRQVYNSLILATWYKKKIKDSILSKVYADRNKVAGVNIDDPNEKQKIYQQYLVAFKKGVYNYIKEDTDPITQQVIPRKYFSGGVSFGETDLGIGNLIQPANESQAMTAVESMANDRAMIIQALAQPGNVPLNAVLATPSNQGGDVETYSGRIFEQGENFFGVRNAFDWIERILDAGEISERRLSSFTRNLKVLIDDPQDIFHAGHLSSENREILNRLLLYREPLLKYALAKDILTLPADKEAQAVGIYLDQSRPRLDDAGLRKQATDIVVQLAHMFGLDSDDVQAILKECVFIRTQVDEPPSSVVFDGNRWEVDEHGVASPAEGFKNDLKILEYSPDEIKRSFQYSRKRDREAAAKQFHAAITQADGIVNQYLSTGVGSAVRAGNVTAIVVNDKRVTDPEAMDIVLTAELAHAMHFYIMGKKNFTASSDPVVLEIFDTLARRIRHGEDNFSVNNPQLGQVFYRWAQRASASGLKDRIHGGSLAYQLAYAVFGDDAQARRRADDRMAFAHQVSAYLVERMIKKAGSAQRAAVVVGLMFEHGFDSWNKDYHEFVKTFDRTLKDSGQKINDLVSQHYGLMVSDRVVSIDKQDNAMAVQGGEELKQSVDNIFEKLKILGQGLVGSNNKYLSILRSAEEKSLSLSQEGWERGSCNQNLLRVIDKLYIEIATSNSIGILNHNQAGYLDLKIVTDLLHEFTVEMELVEKSLKEFADVNLLGLRKDVLRAGQYSPVVYIYWGLYNLLKEFFEDNLDFKRSIIDDFVREIIPLGHNMAAFQHFLAERKVYKPEDGVDQYQQDLRKYVATLNGLEKWQIIYVSPHDPLMAYLLMGSLKRLMEVVGFQSWLLVEGRKVPIVLISNDQTELGILVTMLHEIAHISQHSAMYGQEFNRTVIEGNQIFEEMKQIERLKSQDVDQGFQMFLDRLISQMGHSGPLDPILGSIMPEWTDRQKEIFSYLSQNRGYAEERAFVMALAAFIDGRTHSGQGLKIIGQYVRSGDDEALQRALGKTRYKIMLSFINYFRRSSHEEKSFAYGLVKKVLLKDLNVASLNKINIALKDIFGAISSMEVSAEDEGQSPDEINVVLGSKEFLEGSVGIIEDALARPSQDDGFIDTGILSLMASRLEVLRKDGLPILSEGSLEKLFREMNRLGDSEDTKKDSAQLVQKGDSVFSRFLGSIFGWQASDQTSSVDLGIDVDRLNHILAVNGEYHRVKWNNKGAELFKDLFKRYMIERHADVESQFPSLIGLWGELKTVEPADAFGHISKWMISRINQLSGEPGKEEEFSKLLIEATRFVQMVLRGELKEGDFIMYKRDHPSMIDLLRNEGWNCRAISDLTAVLMGLWGAQGVTVVDVVEDPGGRKFPVPGIGGHAANLVRVGPNVAYLDQGAPPEYKKGRVKVIIDGKEEEKSIADLPSLPGVEGLTVDHVLKLSEAQNEFLTIMGQMEWDTPRKITALKKILEVSRLDPGFQDALTNSLNRLEALQKSRGDSALLSEEEKDTGGIDFKSDKVDSAFAVRNSGGEIKFHIDPAMLEQLQNAPGFVPVIINIQPMNNIRLFLGLTDNQPS